MAERFINPVLQALDNAGTSLADAQLFFFESGTSTPLDTFSDEDLTPGMENTNPVVADSAGRFGDIFLKDQDYKVQLKTSVVTSSVQIWERDPVNSRDTALDSIFAVDFAEVRALTVNDFIDGQFVFIQGRVTPDDGGGGIFYVSVANNSVQVGADEVNSGQGDGGYFFAPNFDKTGATLAIIRIANTTNIDPRWYGYIADAVITGASHPQTATGTDNTVFIQKATDFTKNHGTFFSTVGHTVIFPFGRATTQQVEIPDNIEWKGAGGRGRATELWFVGGSTDDFLVPDSSLAPIGINTFLWEGISVLDGRVTKTSGKFVDLLNAANGIVFRDFLFGVAPAESIAVGFIADNTKAGDNWSFYDGWVSSVNGAAFLVGNINNNCLFDNIFCDGASPVIKRNNGNDSSAVITMSNIKHELSTGTTIEMADDDRYTATDIISTGDNATSVISPTSISASYRNIIGIKLDGATRFPALSNDSNTDVTLVGERPAISSVQMIDSSPSGFAVVRKTKELAVNGGANVDLEIAVNLVANSSFAGKIDIYGVGGRRFACIVHFSGFMTTAGAISSALGAVTSGDARSVDLTAAAPVAMGVADPNRFRINLANASGVQMRLVCNYEFCLFSGTPRLGDE